MHLGFLYPEELVSLEEKFDDEVGEPLYCREEGMEERKSENGESKYV